MKLALRIDSGLAVGQVYSLLSPRHVIGRSVEVSIPIDDTKVSRQHAVIEFTQGVHRLVDMGSTNGTFLNGMRVHQTTELKDGDEIRVGSTVMKVELLERARYLAGKSWRERTNIMPLSQMVPPMPSTEVVRTPTSAGKPAQSLSAKSWISLHDLTPAPHGQKVFSWKGPYSPEQVLYGRWAVALVAGAAIMAAMFLKIG